jgi:hypothetical protein
MDEDYLLARMQASLEMAKRAADPVSRLIHFELAGRYGLAAALACKSPGHDTTTPFHASEMPARSISAA